MTNECGLAVQATLVPKQLVPTSTLRVMIGKLVVERFSKYAMLLGLVMLKLEMLLDFMLVVTSAWFSLSGGKGGKSGCPGSPTIKYGFTLTRFSVDSQSAWRNVLLIFQPNSAF